MASMSFLFCWYQKSRAAGGRGVSIQNSLGPGYSGIQENRSLPHFIFPSSENKAAEIVVVRAEFRPSETSLSRRPQFARLEIISARDLARVRLLNMLWMCAF